MPEHVKRLLAVPYGQATDVKREFGQCEYNSELYPSWRLLCFRVFYAGVDDNCPPYCTKLLLTMGLLSFVRMIAARLRWGQKSWRCPWIWQGKGKSRFCCWKAHCKERKVVVSEVQQRLEGGVSDLWYPIEQTITCFDQQMTNPNCSKDSFPLHIRLERRMDHLAHHPWCRQVFFSHSFQAESSTENAELPFRRNQWSSISS